MTILEALLASVSCGSPNCYHFYHTDKQGRSIHYNFYINARETNLHVSMFFDDDEVYHRLLTIPESYKSLVLLK